MNYELKHEQKQIYVQRISPEYIQYLKILELNNQEVKNILENEYLENPMIEYLEYNQIPKNKIIENTTKIGIEEIYNVPQNSNYECIYNLVKDQLPINKYSKNEIKVIDYLIECLDDNGFCDIDEVLVGKILNVSTKTVQKCIKTLRQLEPYGIFSKNLEQCILVQANAMGILDPIFQKMIEKHLVDIANGKLKKIAKSLNISMEILKKYLKFINNINPRPLQGKGEEINKYIIPDVIIIKENLEWKVYLNDNWIGIYGLSEYYIKTANLEKDKKLKLYFEEKLKKAKSILKAIEKRRQTIVKIVKCIQIRQESFLDCKGPLKFMTMKQISEDTGIHISSVSRAINDKYLQYPGGTILIKNLFTSSIIKSDSELIGSNEIKKILSNIILTEDKKHPYSDNEISKIFNKKGIKISRRTITKYREELGIKGSFIRKELSNE